jgi:hypothetical protein
MICMTIHGLWKQVGERRESYEMRRDERACVNVMIKILLVDRLEHKIGNDSGCRLAFRCGALTTGKAHQVDRHRGQSE